jgi:hypothetical protein
MNVPPEIVQILTSWNIVYLVLIAAIFLLAAFGAITDEQLVTLYKAIIDSLCFWRKSSTDDTTTGEQK